MGLEKGLYTLLTDDAGVSALVGAKVYFVLAPKGVAVPYVVVTRTWTGDCHTMAGDAGTRDALIQMDCYATDYYSSRALSKTVRKLLDSYKGTLSDTDATKVQGIFTEKDWDMPYQEGAKGFVFRSMLEFRVWYVDPQG